jgi:hypothetical protein
MKKNKILFAVSNLWLWHATRSLTIINFYLNKGYYIDIISFWNALKYLKQELKNNKNIEYIELIDYPSLERGFWIMYYLFLIIDLLKTVFLIKKEAKFIKKIYKNYDFIFSDWKYWIYSKNIPSFLLSHQLLSHHRGRILYQCL